MDGPPDPDKARFRAIDALLSGLAAARLTPAEISRDLLSRSPYGAARARDRLLDELEQAGLLVRRLEPFGPRSKPRVTFTLAPRNANGEAPR